MTTIVYDHKNKLIAVDGRVVGDECILSDFFEKWKYSEDGAIWFLCGSVADQQLLVEAFKDGDRAKLDGDLRCNALRVKGGMVTMHGVEDGVAWTHSVPYSRAIGSGFQFAISMLDAGKTVVEAIAYAATRDCYTGGKISVYDIAAGRFIE
jgi:ATP-dependent protease HslVU (ClpYQ) peptidase subunit